MLRRAADPDKDQSYVLGVLTADQLAHAMFPLGDSPKSEVRAEAARRGLVVADKPDSHDICFIPSGDTRGFLAERLAEAPGELVDAASGAVLGRHAGVARFTVGQRHGLGLLAARAGRAAALRAGHRAGVAAGLARPGRGPRRPRAAAPGRPCGTARPG